MEPQESVVASDTSASSHNQWEAVTLPRSEPKAIGEVLERLKMPYPRDFDVQRQQAIQKQREYFAKREAFRKQLPERYRNCTLDNWNDLGGYQRQAKDAVIRWSSHPSDSRHEGLVLYGPVGTGKDHLAIAAIDCRVQRGASARYLNGREFVGEVRDSISRNDPESSLVARYVGDDILLISDPLPPIGDLTQHQADMLYRVVEARYAASKITCCTLNVADDAEADRRLGAATWDRLCHGAWKIHCEWQSFRNPAFELKRKV